MKEQVSTALRFAQPPRGPVIERSQRSENQSPCPDCSAVPLSQVGEALGKCTGSVQ